MEDHASPAPKGTTPVSVEIDEDVVEVPLVEANGETDEDIDEETEAFIAASVLKQMQLVKPTLYSTVGDELVIEADDVIGEEEGHETEVTSTRRQRSKKNRDRAIELHGRSCIVCGFNFDDAYGPDLAEGFIHIHHVKPLHEAGVSSPNIATELVPLCSNCHSMAHRRKEGLTILQLKEAFYGVTVTY